MSVDLDAQFYCPLETRGQTPDLVLWCEEGKVIRFVELTIPWETNIDDAWLRKDSRYGPLVESCEDLGWEAHCLPIEVGARGFVGHRAHALLRQLGFTSKKRKDLIRRMQETVEKASYFIWLKRDRSWKDLTSGCGSLKHGAGVTPYCGLEDGFCIITLLRKHHLECFTLLPLHVDGLLASGIC